MVDLETAAQAAVSRSNRVRLVAIKSLLFGVTQDQGAGIFDVTQRTLSNWVRRFNYQGIDGLIDRTKSGRPPKITPEQTSVYQELIEHPDRADQVHCPANSSTATSSKSLSMNWYTAPSCVGFITKDFV